MASTVSGTERWLLVEVVDCNLLRNSNHISMFRDPFVSLQYAGNILHSPTCTQDWLNPIYKCTAAMPLIEDQREVTFTVRSSNTGGDDFIASGSVEVQIDVLADSIYCPLNCLLHDRTGRYAGTMDVVLRIVSSQEELQHYAPSSDDPSASMNIAAADPAAPVNMAAAAPAAAPRVPPISVRAAPSYTPPIGAYPAVRAAPSVPPILALGPLTYPFLFFAHPADRAEPFVPPISVTATPSYRPPIGAYPAARAEPFVPPIFGAATPSYPPPMGAYPAAAVSAIPYRALAAAYSPADPTAPNLASANPRGMMQYPLRQPNPPPIHPPRPNPPPQAQPPRYPPGFNPGNRPPRPH